MAAIWLSIVGLSSSRKAMVNHDGVILSPTTFGIHLLTVVMGVRS